MTIYKFGAFWFTRYCDFKIERSDWTRNGVNGAKFEFWPKFVTSQFRDYENVMHYKKSEKTDCWFTRYRNFKIEQSDWPREGVNEARSEVCSKLVNSPFRDHGNITQCKNQKKRIIGSRDIVISKLSDLIGQGIFPPGGTPWGGMKKFLKNYSTRWYGSNEVSTLSIEAFFTALWTFFIFFDKKCHFRGYFCPLGVQSIRF